MTLDLQVFLTCSSMTHLHPIFHRLADTCLTCSLETPLLFFVRASLICDRVHGNWAYVGEIDFEIQSKTVGAVSLVEVAFIFLKFRIGIIESCHEV